MANSFLALYSLLMTFLVLCLDTCVYLFYFCLEHGIPGEYH